MAPSEGWRTSMSLCDPDVDKAHVKDRIESFVSYGKPICDVCYALDADERPDDAEFWPTPITHFVRADESCAVSFWGVSVCEHHDSFEYVPEDATHRVVDEPQYIGDTHRINSAYEHVVTDIQELQL